MARNAAERVTDRRVEAMAYRRDDFKNKLESHLTGAIVEYYKAALAKKNRQSRYVDHWMSEVKELIEIKLVAEILHPIRGFKDRGKAFAEAVAEIQSGDARYRRYAETTVKGDYGMTKLKASLDDADRAAFWARVDAVAVNALAAAR